MCVDDGAGRGFAPIVVMVAARYLVRMCCIWYFGLGNFNMCHVLVDGVYPGFALWLLAH